MTIMSDQPLCILTVHAHPDDEASKGAPTLAMYGASGVRTVLVCCTGGEEGDINNPGLKEPGQPFHDVSPERERELLAQMRPLECWEAKPTTTPSASTWQQTTMQQSGLCVLFV